LVSENPIAEDLVKYLSGLKDIEFDGIHSTRYIEINEKGEIVDIKKISSKGQEFKKISSNYNSVKHIEIHDNETNKELIKSVEQLNPTKLIIKEYSM
jgi:hypothetical protein